MGFSYIKKEKINAIPKTAGVYAFYADKKILYIGKAGNLRDRIKDHFHQPSYRDNLFVEKVNRIGVMQTQSEIDALLLESKLIKQFQPAYNVMWKDDKKYFYVAITREPLPRVFLTHQENAPAKYIGPFVEGKAIKEVLRLLRHVFPYYTKKHGIKPCSWCHLNLCPGPLAGQANPNVKTYNQNIKRLQEVLQGKRLSVLKNLKKEMQKASQDQRFEQAAKLRDQFLALEKIVAHSKIFHAKYEIQRIEAYDISNMQGKEATGSMVTFIGGKPAKQWYRKFKIRISGSPNDFAMIQELVSRRLKHPEWPYPDLIIIDGGKPQLTAALQALRKSEIRNSKFEIKVAAIAKKHNELFLPKKSKPILLKNLPQPLQNLILHIRDEAHRFAIAYHKKLRRVDFFGAR